MKKFNNCFKYIQSKKGSLIRSNIPPITSTGNKVRNPNARLAGLANISLGRYKSNMKKSEEENESSFDITKFSKSDFNKQSKQMQKTTKTFIPDEPIICIIDIVEPFNGNDFAIVLPIFILAVVLVKNFNI